MVKNKKIIHSIFALVVISGALILLLHNTLGQNIAAKSPSYLPENLINTYEDAQVSTLLSCGKNFKTFDIAKNYSPQYLYEIYNNSGEMVKRETVMNHPPTIIYPSDSLLSIEIVAGTELWLTQYYDTDKDLFSEVFPSPLALQDNKVVYMVFADNAYKLIVSDIFDPSKYYKEFSLDFSPVANPVNAIISVEYLGNDKLQVKYLSNGNRDKKSVILQL